MQRKDWKHWKESWYWSKEKGKNYTYPINKYAISIIKIGNELLKLLAFISLESQYSSHSIFVGYL